MTTLGRLISLANEAGDQLADPGPLKPFENAILTALGDHAREELLRMSIERYSTSEILADKRNNAILFAGGGTTSGLTECIAERVETCADNKGEINVASLLVEVEPRCSSATVTLTDCLPHAVLALLRSAPDPLPVDAVASAMDVTSSTLLQGLAELLDARMIEQQGDFLVAQGRVWTFKASDHANVLARGLSALAIHLQTASRHGRSQLRNLMALGEGCLGTNPDVVARIFAPAEHPAKDAGDMYVVLDVARLTISAARRSRRGVDEIKAESHALACGLAWVLQRIGDLAEARVALQRSERLADDIGWTEHRAHSRKCWGRLDRRNAEEERDPKVREALLGTSETKLQEAIKRFEQQGDPAEAGDAWSLLGRTYLVWERFDDARAAIAEARQRLPAGSAKEYLDVLILEADVERTDPRGSTARSGQLYREVLSLTSADGRQCSEMRARALLGLAELQPLEDALASIEGAAKMYDDLNSHDSAALARLRGLARANKLCDGIISDKNLDVLDIVHSHHVHEERQREATAPGAAHRAARMDRAYWQSVIKEGCGRAAKYRRPWRI